MTPAIKLAEKSGIRFDVHSYEHDENSGSYGLEAAEKLGLDVQHVFKTLVVELDTGKLAVAILPVDSMLSMKQLAKAAGAKKASMASPSDVQRSTGYVLGGVSPLGQKKVLNTYLHDSAQALERIYVSAGKRGLEIELAPDSLLKLTSGTYAPLI